MHSICPGVRICGYCIRLLTFLRTMNPKTEEKEPKTEETKDSTNWAGRVGRVGRVPKVTPPTPPPHTHTLQDQRRSVVPNARCNQLHAHPPLEKRFRPCGLPRQPAQPAQPAQPSGCYQVAGRTKPPPIPFRSPSQNRRRAVRWGVKLATRPTRPTRPSPVGATKQPVAPPPLQSLWTLGARVYRAVMVACMRPRTTLALSPISASSLKYATSCALSAAL